MTRAARPARRLVARAGLLLAAALLLPGFVPAADSPWLYGIHWYGDPTTSTVEQMTGGKGIWSLEIVQTNSDIWWGAAWQRDNRFNAMRARGHTLICRLERNWGEGVPFPEHVAPYLVDVAAAAQTLSGTCHIWQIANEMNLYSEWGGNELTPAVYADLYKQIRAAIKSVPSSLGEQVVLVGPVSPGDPVSGVRHTGGNEYLAALCSLLTPADVDGFAFHGYAAPWNSVSDSRAEFTAGYLTQLAILDGRGFAAHPVYVTEWNRSTDPLNDTNEAASAQFLQGALADLHSWNGLVGAHPITSACWFIYAYDSGTWANYSIAYLHGLGPSGPANDLWDALQFACTQDYPAGCPTTLTPRLTDGQPAGANIAPAATVSTDTGNGQLAIDGTVSVGSKWTSAGSPPPHWLQLDLGALRQVTGYVVRHAGAAGEPAYYNTTAWQFRTATTATGPWEIDGTVYNATAENATPRRYATPRPLRYVRLYITDPGIDDYARIPEFEVYAVPLPGDYNNDGMVSWADIPNFIYCLKGPGRTYAGTHSCVRGDADSDLDVDLADFANLQINYVSSN